MVGCKKENVRENEVQNTPNEFGVSTDGKMLIFKTVDDYEKTIDGANANKHEILFQTIEGLQFKNYFSKSETKSNEENAMDNFLGKLLNPDGVIQIEDHIYKVDLPNEKVYVIEIKNKETDYNDLVAGNSSNKNVSVYSTDDDVLHAVKEGVVEKCGGIGSFDKSTSKISPPPCHDLIPFDCRIRFFKGGIIFNLYAEANAYYASIGFYNMYLELNPVYYVKRPCGSSNTTGPYNVVNYQSSIGASLYQKFQSYQGSRNLNQCQFRARVKVTGNDCSGNPYTVYSPWVQNY